MAGIAAHSKWIEGLAADQPVEDAARRVLELRLRRVWELLPAAAYEAEQDVEHVHQLRVASRRAHAALLAFDAYLPRRRGRKLDKQLRRVRRAAGDARDFDVQLARLKSLADSGDASAAELLPRIAKRRAKAQPRIARMHRKLEAQRFPDQVTEMLGRVRAPAEAGEERLGAFAANSIRRATERFFAAEAFAADGYAALHRFRIRAKSLRYTLEIFASLWPDSVREDIYPVVEEAQELLGEIVDRHVAIVRFDSWRRDCRRESVRDAFKQLWKREQTALADSLTKLDAWWTPERSRWLREQIANLVDIDHGATLVLHRSSM